MGNIVTSLPSKVASDMKKLLEWYDKITKKTIEDIIEFHVRFESISSISRWKWSCRKNDHV